MPVGMVTNKLILDFKNLTVAKICSSALSSSLMLWFSCRLGEFVLCAYALYRPSDMMGIQPDTGCILGKSVNTL